MRSLLTRRDKDLTQFQFGDQLLQDSVVSLNGAPKPKPAFRLAATSFE